MAKIRIIDDDVEQCALLSAALKRAGHVVSMFHQIDGAWEALEAEQPDLVLLDVMFPENASGGLELVLKIRQNEKTKHLPVILLTNINEVFPIALSRKDIDPKWMPARDFLDKPADSQGLLQKVAEVLKQP